MLTGKLNELELHNLRSILCTYAVHLHIGVMSKRLEAKRIVERLDSSQVVASFKPHRVVGGSSPPRHGF